KQTWGLLLSPGLDGTWTIRTPDGGSTRYSGRRATRRKRRLPTRRPRSTNWRPRAGDSWRRSTTPVGEPNISSSSGPARQRRETDLDGRHRRLERRQGPRREHGEHDARARQRESPQALDTAQGES